MLAVCNGIRMRMRIRTRTDAYACVRSRLNAAARGCMCAGVRISVCVLGRHGNAYACVERWREHSCVRLLHCATMRVRMACAYAWAGMHIRMRYALVHGLPTVRMRVYVRRSAWRCVAYAWARAHRCAAVRIRIETCSRKTMCMAMCRARIRDISPCTPAHIQPRAPTYTRIRTVGNPPCTNAYVRIRI